jgi:N-hydroxyarylamine O-acetyltransferase
MFLTVDVDDNRFVVDPGFGGHGALVPVPVREGTEVRDGIDRHRMVRNDGEWVLEADIDGTMTALWTSTLEPQLPIDFELANYWVSTAPASPFINRLMLRALTPGGRTSVMNRDVTVVREGKTEQYQVADRRALRALLAEHFGFDLPDVEKLRVPMIPEWS